MRAITLEKFLKKYNNMFGNDDIDAAYKEYNVIESETIQLEELEQIEKQLREFGHRVRFVHFENGSALCWYVETL